MCNVVPAQISCGASPLYFKEHFSVPETLPMFCTSFSQDQDGEGELGFSSGTNQTEGSRTTGGEYQVRGSVKGREEKR